MNQLGTTRPDPTNRRFIVLPWMSWMNWLGAGLDRQAPQHFLYFLPLPQGQRSFRPTLGCVLRTSVWGASELEVWTEGAGQLESGAEDAHQRPAGGAGLSGPRRPANDGQICARGGHGQEESGAVHSGEGGVKVMIGTRTCKAHASPLYTGGAGENLARGDMYHEAIAELTARIVEAERPEKIIL